jgi:murein DD-endopeptidase MepM/ murein hydrolase activator NlpD
LASADKKEEATVVNAAKSKAVTEEAIVLEEKPAAKSVARYFIQPASGTNWGILHTSNAVDIANACGTAIVAAASGVVVERETGWNSGYGNYIMMEHPNGTKTRYAHMRDMYAKVGDYVNQGAQIGTIGNTGYVEGRTGCHVHFEVKGATNPFTRK